MKKKETDNQKVKRLDRYKVEKICTVEGCKEKFLGGVNSKYCWDHKK